MAHIHDVIADMGDKGEVNVDPYAMRNETRDQFYNRVRQELVGRSVEAIDTDSPMGIAFLRLKGGGMFGLGDLYQAQVDAQKRLAELQDEGGCY